VGGEKGKSEKNFSRGEKKSSSKLRKSTRVRRRIILHLRLKREGGREFECFIG